MPGLPIVSRFSLCVGCFTEYAHIAAVSIALSCAVEYVEIRTWYIEGLLVPGGILVLDVTVSVAHARLPRWARSLLDIILTHTRVLPTFKMSAVHLA